MRTALLAATCLTASALRPLRRTLGHFRKTRPAGLWNDATAPTYDGTKPLKVCVWNVQYGAGIRQHYFYDGGDAVSAPRHEVEDGIKKIGDAIATIDPDIVLLQEVDRRSRRTHKIDELACLRERLDFPCAASAAYWRVPYVPHPSSEHVGRIGMHLCTLSKFQLGDAKRHQLPLLRESRVRQLFNLRRCVLETPLVNGPTLFNTHLSAFSYGDGTVERQVSRLRELVEGKDSFLLAGDLNSLTPYENAASLAKDEAALYPESSTPAAPLYDDAGIVPLWRDAAARRATYKPWTSPVPVRNQNVAPMTAPARWRGGFTPSTRCCPQNCICSMAWSFHAIDATLSPKLRLPHRLSSTQAGTGPHDRPRLLLARRGLRGRRRLRDGRLPERPPARGV